MRFFDGNRVIVDSDDPRETLCASNFAELMGITTAGPVIIVNNGVSSIAYNDIEIEHISVSDELTGSLKEQVVLIQIVFSAMGIQADPDMGVAAAGNVVLLRSSGGFGPDYETSPLWEGASDAGDQLNSIKSQLPTIGEVKKVFLLGGFSLDKAPKEAKTVMGRISKVLNG